MNAMAPAPTVKPMIDSRPKPTMLRRDETNSAPPRPMPYAPTSTQNQSSAGFADPKFPWVLGRLDSLIALGQGYWAHPVQGERDKYGRLLAYLFLPDGTNINLAMIAGGYAHEYTYNLPYKYQTQFKAAEKTAREAKLGLWADAACAAESARS